MKFNKIIISGFFIFLLFCPVLVSAASTTPVVSLPSDQMKSFKGSAGFSETHAESIVATIIKTILGLLGILFVVLMIMGGFQWMTAGGNEESVKKAQGRIKNAVIGLIIIVMAYGVTAFVFKNLPGGIPNQTHPPVG